jgi:hypothetical protein
MKAEIRLTIEMLADGTFKVKNSENKYLEPMDLEKLTDAIINKVEVNPFSIYLQTSYGNCFIIGGKLYCPK